MLLNPSLFSQQQSIYSLSQKSITSTKFMIFIDKFAVTWSFAMEGFDFAEYCETEGLFYWIINWLKIAYDIVKGMCLF